MAAAKPNLERTKEASATHNYVLAAESFTRAIDARPATARLYADRALALIMLGSYVGACGFSLLFLCPMQYLFNDMKI